MQHSLENHELREWYESRGFGGRVGFGSSCAVIAIDVARGWLDPDVDLGSAQAAVLDSIVEVINAAREISLPVFFTTMGFREDGKDAGEVYNRKLPLTGTQRAGSRDMELHPAVERRDDEVLIVKPRASGFFATNLLSQLVSLGVDTTIVVGLSTSGCIRATCESAFDYGYHVIVPQEAVGDRCSSAHQGSLFDIDMRLGDVMPMAEAIEGMRQTAGVTTA
jgi:maleamate amidohydrolase